MSSIDPAIDAARTLFQTKTFWANFLGPVFMWLSTKYGLHLTADQQFDIIVIVMAAANIVLRRFTRTPVTILPTKTINAVKGKNMTIESYLERVAGGLEKKAASVWSAMTTYASEGIQYLKNFFTVLIPDEVHALAPYAEQALQEAEADIPTLVAGLVSTGSPAVALTDYVTALTPVLVSTAQKAETAGVTAAGAAVATAVQGAIANIAASQAQAPVPSANTLAVAPTASAAVADPTDNGDGSSAPAVAPAGDNGDGSSAGPVAG